MKGLSVAAVSAEASPICLICIIERQPHECNIDAYVFFKKTTGNLRGHSLKLYNNPVRLALESSFLVRELLTIGTVIMFNMCSLKCYNIPLVGVGLCCPICWGMLSQITKTDIENSRQHIISKHT